MTREPAREYRATWLVRVYEHEQAGWTWNLLYDGRLLNACSGYTTEAEAMRSGERALARSVGQEERSTSAWRPANNGTGKRIWFVYRDAPDVSSRYHEDSRGYLIRYATHEQAAKAAERLNALQVAR